MPVFYGNAATWLAKLEAGDGAGDTTILVALERKWQAVLDHLLRLRKLALLARGLEEEVEAFEPTEDPQGAWISEADLRQIYAKPPRDVIEKFEQLRREESDRSATQRQSRLAAGRYTLWDAAQEIGIHTGTPFERVLDALLACANSGTLTVYERGATFPYKPERPLGALAGHEAYWSDLNAWLNAHKVQSAFTFPAPEGAPGAPGQDEPNAIVEAPDLAAYVAALGIGVRVESDSAHGSAAGQSADAPMNVVLDVEGPKGRRGGRELRAAILQEIRKLGHDPHRFPKNRSGKPGPKAAVRDRLGFAPDNQSAFLHAWDRLCNDHDIEFVD